MIRVACVLMILVSASLANASPVIAKVRLGFPSSQGDITRNAFWMPVKLELSAGTEPVASSLLELETTDGEGAIYQVHAQIPPMEANSNKAIFTYIRPGSAASILTIRWKTQEGKILKTWVSASRTSTSMAGPRDFIIALAGCDLPKLKETAIQMSKTDTNKQVTLERQARKFVDLMTLEDLPDQEIGYEAIDILVLSSKSSLASELLREPEQKRLKALSNWLLGGGRILLDSGSSYETTQKLLQGLGTAECTIPKMDRNAEGLRALNGLNRWVTPLVGQLLPMRVKELAVLKPGRFAQTVVREPSEPSDPVERPILVQIPRSRGRILLFALQFDEAPFTSWDGQQSFYNQLLIELSPRNPGYAPGKFPPDTSVPRQEISGEFLRSLETFEQVPVFPFGWVAILLLTYIGVVGPLDYLVTQRWLKKPGLTWISFPLIVLGCSWAAWATAESFKGNQARLNKIDLLDVDQTLGVTQASSWFSFFSPAPGEYSFEIQHPEKMHGLTKPNSPRISVLEPPDRNFRGGSRTLFRTPYEYTPGGNGVEHFGIPAWATATFEGQWSAKAEPSPVNANLRHSRIDPTILIGSITNNLPFEIEDSTLFYHDTWYSLGKLQPGETRRIDNLQVGGRGLAIQNWYDSKILGQITPPNKDTQYFSLQRLLKATLFHAHPEATDPLFNSMLRKLDQSWRMKQVAESFLDATTRIRHAEEVILVGHTSDKTDKAACSLTAQIKETTGKTNSPVQVASSQETFIRAILAIQQGTEPITDKTGEKND